MTTSHFKTLAREVIENEGLSQALFDVLDAFESASLPEPLRQELADQIRALVATAGEIGQIEDNFPETFDD